MTQWRVRGKGVTIGGDGAGEEGVRQRIFRRMRVVEGADRESISEEVRKWEWERQVTTYFASHTPAMRGVFSFSLSSPCVARYRRWYLLGNGGLMVPRLIQKPNPWHASIPEPV
jgi:hypothetical protein